MDGENVRIEESIKRQEFIGLADIPVSCSTMFLNTLNSQKRNGYTW